MKGNWDSEFILNRSERRIVNIKEDGYLCHQEALVEAGLSFHGPS